MIRYYRFRDGGWRRDDFMAVQAQWPVPAHIGVSLLGPDGRVICLRFAEGDRWFPDPPNAHVKRSAKGSSDRRWDLDPGEDGVQWCGFTALPERIRAHLQADESECWLALAPDALPIPSAAGTLALDILTTADGEGDVSEHGISHGDEVGGAYCVEFVRRADGLWIAGWPGGLEAPPRVLRLTGDPGGPIDIGLDPCWQPAGAALVLHTTGAADLPGVLRNMALGLGAGSMARTPLALAIDEGQCWPEAAVMVRVHDEVFSLDAARRLSRRGGPLELIELPQPATTFALRVDGWAESDPIPVGGRPDATWRVRPVSDSGRWMTFAVPPRDRRFVFGPGGWHGPYADEPPADGRWYGRVHRGEEGALARGIGPDVAGWLNRRRLPRPNEMGGHGQGAGPLYVFEPDPSRHGPAGDVPYGIVMSALREPPDPMADWQPLAHIPRALAKAPMIMSWQGLIDNVHLGCLDLDGSPRYWLHFARGIAIGTKTACDFIGALVGPFADLGVVMKMPGRERGFLLQNARDAGPRVRVLPNDDPRLRSAFEVAMPSGRVRPVRDETSWRDGSAIALLASGGRGAGPLLMLEGEQIRLIGVVADQRVHWPLLGAGLAMRIGLEPGSAPDAKASGGVALDGRVAPGAEAPLGGAPVADSPICLLVEPRARRGTP